MKKIVLCAAAVAMLGFASCSNKSAENAETANVDSPVMDTTLTVATEVDVDSVAPGVDSVSVQQAAVETVTPEATK